MWKVHFGRSDNKSVVYDLINNDLFIWLDYRPSALVHGPCQNNVQNGTISYDNITKNTRGYSSTLYLYGRFSFQEL